MRSILLLFAYWLVCVSLGARIDQIRTVASPKNTAAAQLSQVPNKTVVKNTNKPIGGRPRIVPISKKRIKTSVNRGRRKPATNVATGSSNKSPPPKNSSKSSAQSRVVDVEPLVSNVTSRAGHFAVSENIYLFFWFFRSRRNATDPLIVWLQGQPGASSLYGAFDENGPFYIESGKQSAGLRNHTWINAFNVLYLDHQPVCGFSYAKGDVVGSQTLSNVTKNVLLSLKQFYTHFPEVGKNDLYLAAESIGAKYVLVIAHAIIRSPPSYRVNLKGLLIGNAFVDEMQLFDYPWQLFRKGLIDQKTLDEEMKHQDILQMLMRTKNYESVWKLWEIRFSNLSKVAGYESPYDERIGNAFWNSPVPDFVNLPAIRNKLKVMELKFQPALRSCLTEEALRPIKTIISEVLDHVKVSFSKQFQEFDSRFSM